MPEEMLVEVQLDASWWKNGIESQQQFIVLQGPWDGLTDRAGQEQTWVEEILISG